jgi:signal peptidase I
VARRPEGSSEPDEAPTLPLTRKVLPREAPPDPVSLGDADGHRTDATARVERTAAPTPGVDRRPSAAPSEAATTQQIPDREPGDARPEEQPPREPPRGGRKGTSRKRKGPFSFLKELPALIVIAFVLALLIKSFLVQAFFIPSESMEQTLKPGDRVLVNKVVYHLHPPRRGDVIVFESHTSGAQPDRGVISGFFHWITEGLGISPPDDEDFIKRVIGLPGDTVEERDNGDFFVNGKKLDEPYLKGPKDTQRSGVWHVPKGELFVLGDNRTNSNDSRFGGIGIRGFVPVDWVVGKAFIIIWPPSRFGGLAGGTHFAGH